MVFPTPGYNAQHGLAGVTGRTEHLLEAPPSASRRRAALRPARGAFSQRPRARGPLRPLEATYLAWLDASAYGHDDAAAVALEHGRVMVSAGHTYAPGSTGQVRLNIATSPARLTEIVERLARAWT